MTEGERRIMAGAPDDPVAIRILSMYVKLYDEVQSQDGDAQSEAMALLHIEKAAMWSVKAVTIERSE